MDDSVCKNINVPLLKAIFRYRNHPSIVTIKKICATKSHFSFANVEKEEILKEINNLNLNKAIQNTDVPTKIIKKKGVFEDFIFSILNGCINTPLYTSLLKVTDITVAPKKDSKSAKSNYRRVSMFQTSPKCMSRLFKQISEHFEGFSSRYYCGFKKRCSAQYCVILMLEK